MIHKLIFILITIFIFTACSDSAASKLFSTDMLSGDKQHGQYTWTLMIYLDGDNDLEPDALNDINEMERVDLSQEGVNVIVLIDRSRYYTSDDGNWSGTRLYKITPDGDPNIIHSERLADPNFLHLTDSGDIEELNMGDPETLRNFIDFCQINYKADKYALVLWNHGDGWRSRSDLITTTTKSIPARFEISPRYIDTCKDTDKKTKNKAICYDESAGGDWLYLDELRLAVTDKNIELIGFDACLMGMIEVAYELKDHVNYMVSSEEIEPTTGWVYDQFLYKTIMLADNSAMHIGRNIIDTYIENTDSSNLTLSLLYLPGINQLVSELNTTISAVTTVDPDTICKIRQGTHSYDNYHSIDLLHFIDRIPEKIDTSYVKQTFNETVLYNKTKGNTRSNGLAIYFPYYYAFDSYYHYYDSPAVDFVNNANWKSFLTAYFTKVKTYTIETFANGYTGSNYTDTYLMIFDSNGLIIYENDDKDFSDQHSKLTLPLASGETYYIVCFDEYGQTGGYSILINENGNGSSQAKPDINAFEPNNDYQSANRLFINIIQDHFLSLDDLDWFVVTIP